MHLTLMGVEHRLQDLPVVEFDKMDTETPLNVMQRATMGYQSGILTLNQALEMLNLPTASGGNSRDGKPIKIESELPRENSQPGASDSK